jgi:hypothetical protein
MTKEEALKAAYLAGFNASGEGYNSEYPFEHKGKNCTDDPIWCKDRDNELAAIKQALAAQPAPVQEDWGPGPHEVHSLPAPVDWKTEYLKSVESGCSTLDELREARAELDALKKALAAPTVQEPCGRLESDPDEGHIFVPRIEGDWSMLGEDLYTIPPAQPAVPDALFRHAPEHPQYIEGWNDCRAKMLKGMKP